MKQAEINPRLNLAEHDVPERLRSAFDKTNPRKEQLELSGKRARDGTDNDATLDPDLVNNIGRKLAKAKSTFVDAPAQSSKTIFSDFGAKVKGIFGDFLDETKQNGNMGQIRKIAVGAVSALFFVFGLKSTVEFVKDLYSKNKNKPSWILKGADALLKWVMAFGTLNFLTARQNATIKLKGLKTIVGGVVASFVLSQLNGFKYTKDNFMGKVAGVLPGGKSLLNDITNISAPSYGSSQGTGLDTISNYGRQS